MRGVSCNLEQPGSEQSGRGGGKSREVKRTRRLVWGGLLFIWNKYMSLETEGALAFDFSM